MILLWSQIHCPYSLSLYWKEKEKKTAFCVTQIKLYRFEMAWGWENDDRISVWVKYPFKTTLSFRIITHAVFCIYVDCCWIKRLRGIFAPCTERCKRVLSGWNRSAPTVWMLKWFNEVCSNASLQSTYTD